MAAVEWKDEDYDVLWRIAVDDAIVGKIIGPRGAAIKTFVTQTGAQILFMKVEGTHHKLERIVSIRSGNQEQRTKALELLTNRIVDLMSELPQFHGPELFLVIPIEKLPRIISPDGTPTAAIANSGTGSVTRDRPNFDFVVGAHETIVCVRGALSTIKDTASTIFHYIQGPLGSYPEDDTAPPGAASTSKTVSPTPQGRPHDDLRNMLQPHTAEPTRKRSRSPDDSTSGRKREGVRRSAGGEGATAKTTSADSLVSQLVSSSFYHLVQVFVPKSIIQDLLAKDREYLNHIQKYSGANVAVAEDDNTVQQYAELPVIINGYADQQWVAQQMVFEKVCEAQTAQGSITFETEMYIAKEFIAAVLAQKDAIVKVSEASIQTGDYENLSDKDPCAISILGSFENNQMAQQRIRHIVHDNEKKSRR